MGQGIFRCVLVIAVLILIFVFGTKGFSYSLADAYGVLIGQGWTVKDALGFLGTSIAGTIAMNPSLAPAAAAGALSAYIAVKGSQLYDIYREWRNLRTGIAMLNPVEYSQSMAVKTLAKGQYGWTYIRLVVYQTSTPGLWDFYWDYRESYNNNGAIAQGWFGGDSGWSKPKDAAIQEFNRVLNDIVHLWKDGEGQSMFTALVQTAYNNLLSNNNFSYVVGREVVPALETGSAGVSAATLGYRVNVDPQNISEDGVNYLNDPDAFYQWFLTNYMSGTNEGTFVTPLNEAYDEIRNDLQIIIDKLNSLSATGGGVSEETLNQMKTEILNAMNTQLSGIDTQLSGIDSKLTGVDTKLSGLDSTLTGVSNSVNSLHTDVTTLSNGVNGIDSKLDSLQGDIAGVKTSVDTVISDMSAAQEQEQSFWDRLMEWLDVTFFEKLKELLKELFLPTEEQLEQLFDIQLPEYQKNFVADVSVSSQSTSIPISLFGASVDLSGYITQYASGLRQFMNIFVSGLAAFFVIRAFRVHLNID